MSIILDPPKDKKNNGKVIVTGVLQRAGRKKKVSCMMKLLKKF